MRRAEDLLPVTVDRTPPGAPCAWAAGKEFLLPADLAAESGLAAVLEAGGRLRVDPGLAIPAETAQRMRRRRAFTEHPPSSSRLPLSYRLVPAPLRTVAARAIGLARRRQLRAGRHSPRWPLDLAADFLADLAPRPDPGRQEGPAPVLLTHDLDTPEGLANLVGRFLEVEEARGARSTSFVVPCAWPLDGGLLAEIGRRGHGLGIHGHDHRNRTAFLDGPARRQRLAAGRELARARGMTGYRAPSLLRTAGLLRDLAPLYRYDSSVTTAGHAFPLPFRGCASARPFRLEGIVEIPLSLPPEAGLTFLSFGPEQILRIWIECAGEIAAAGGVVVLLTHCENRFSGSGKLFTVYSRFLDHLAGSPRFRWSTPEEILAGWDARHERDQGT